MGHFSSSTDAVVQTWTASRAFSTPRFGTTRCITLAWLSLRSAGQAFASYDQGLFNTVPSRKRPRDSDSLGANVHLLERHCQRHRVGHQFECLLQQQSGSCAPAVLHAYSATTLANELWNSFAGNGNVAGNAVNSRFHGREWQGLLGRVKQYRRIRRFDLTPGEIDVYGLLPN